MRRWKLLLLAATPFAFAGEADVLSAEVACNTDSVCRFDVTVTHEDEDWDHYSNRWEVLTPDGKVIATRTLHHPHVNEQPFTRSLSGVKIPDNLRRVVIRGHDSVHGYGGKEEHVELNSAKP